MFKYITQKKGIEFLFEKEGDIPRYQFGDDIRLRQVITNICGNAVKFTKEGFVKLKVTGTPSSLIFVVSDTGIGVKKEDMPKLFQTFTQVDKQKNRSLTGTGLGLTISKTFVEMMGGTIEFDSEYGKGTAFTVTLPRVEGDGGKVMAETAAGRTFSAPDAKILVVDDNQFNIKVAHGLLGLHGIKPVTAMSGKKAIELVRQTDFDMVFMDHMMPEMDGVETTARIRALGGKYKDLAIIALTANAVAGAKEMFLRNGFNGFISKPIDNAKLSQMLAEWLPAKIVRDGQGGGADSGGGPENAPPSFMAALGEIGLDAEIGLRRFSGVESLYREVVRDFYQSLRLYCDKMAAEVRDGDFAAFSIDVHTIKSSLATVGAMPLSKTAQELEDAAKGGNRGHCLEAYPDFHEKLLALREQLGGIFAEPGDAAVADGATKKRPGNPAYLSEQITIALAAAEDFEIEPGKEAVNRLLAFDFGGRVNAALEKAMAAFNDFDTMAAAKILDGI
jgi:CheY-like chemotaxis protein/HPt (histidine-containing phosphotransfer) domain-containing protein